MCVMPDANRMLVTMESHQAVFAYSCKICARVQRLDSKGLFWCKSQVWKDLWIPGHGPDGTSDN